VSSIEPDKEAFFLLPVDIPLVRKRTLLQAMEAYRACGKGIVYPTFLGRRGHPPLIAARYAEEIVQWNGSGGLRSFLKQKESDAVNVAVSDEHIVLDMDTPADYENILQKWANYDIPSVAECMELLRERCCAKSKLVAHSRKVAQLALIFGKALNERGFHLNLDLIAAAGLLHDMSRGEPRHASTAARVLRDMGYPAVAEIVEHHMNLEPRPDQPVNERDVVCLADKLVLGDVIVSLEERFENRLDCHSGDPDAQEAIAARLEHARHLRARVEHVLGTSIDSFLANPGTH
jgi:5'-deoxynucleotidase YfbR-like HD superfamily hydrolase